MKSLRQKSRALVRIAALVLAAMTLPPATAQVTRVQYLFNADFIDFHEHNRTLSALTSAGVGVTLFSSVTDLTPWTSGLGITIIPETELRPLLPSMPPEVTQAIRQYVNRGGRLIVLHVGSQQGRHLCRFSRCVETDFINTVFGFRLEQCPSPNDIRSLWPRTDAAAGTVWSSSSTSVPDRSNTLGVAMSSLPTGSAAMYGVAGCAVSGTIPFGAGHVLWYGYDWFDEDDAAWDQILVAGTRSTAPLLPPLGTLQPTPAPTQSPAAPATGLAVLANFLYSLPFETFNLIFALRSFGFRETVVVDLTSPTLLQGTVVVAETTRRAIVEDMSPSMQAAIRQFLQSGGKYVFAHVGGQVAARSCPGGTCNELQTVNQLFNFTIAECGPVGGSPYLRDSDFARGSVFSAAPFALPDPFHTHGMSVSSLPPTARAVYTNNGCAVVVVVPYGLGYITLLGFDWFRFSNVQWNRVLFAVTRQSVLPLIPSTSTQLPPTTPPTPSPTSNAPASSPTEEPTSVPTNSPTEAPTFAPTNSPTEVPTSSAPTTSPSVELTSVPTSSAPSSAAPTSVAPTSNTPTSEPPSLTSVAPVSESPTDAPADAPTSSAPSDEVTSASTTTSPTEPSTTASILQRTTRSDTDELTLTPLTTPPTAAPTEGNSASLPSEGNTNMMMGAGIAIVGGIVILAACGAVYKCCCQTRRNSDKRPEIVPGVVPEEDHRRIMPIRPPPPTPPHPNEGFQDPREDRGNYDDFNAYSRQVSVGGAAEETPLYDQPQDPRDLR
mmetsp:Transcript_12493/g.37498  ORF Transcript_12493/g.37498 Transcript_12493/m.37498 type:complete len:775 (-) Transcript_12493:173-2497(-)